MRSLRARLIAWYMSVGAFIVAVIGLIAAVAVVEAASFEARQAMAAAARDVPVVVQQYRDSHPDAGDLDFFLHNRFRTFGLIVHARGPEMQMVRAVPMLGPPPFPPQAGAVRVAFGPDHASLYERLLAMQIKPVSASFPGGEAVIFVDPNSLQGVFKRLGIFLLILAIVVLTAAWRIAVVVAENTLEPLLRTTEALNRFGGGQFVPVDVRPEDRSELGELARAYNRAVGQVTRALDERAKAEAEMRQFVADAGHQLRTPLTVLMGYVSGMAERARSDQEKTRFTAMLTQSRRMKELIDRLITLARLERRESSSQQHVDLNDLAACVRQSFGESAQQRIVLHDAKRRLIVHADEADLRDALCAIVDNALKYAPNGSVDMQVVQDGETARLEITDHGPGMLEEDLQSAFDRFYRGSAAEETSGTGLGLAIARKSIERAGGSIRVANCKDGGLRVAVTFAAAR